MGAVLAETVSVRSRPHFSAGSSARTGRPIRANTTAAAGNRNIRVTPGKVPHCGSWFDEGIVPPRPQNRSGRCRGVRNVVSQRGGGQAVRALRANALAQGEVAAGMLFA